MDTDVTARKQRFAPIRTAQVPKAIRNMEAVQDWRPFKADLRWKRYVHVDKESGIAFEFAVTEQRKKSDRRQWYVADGTKPAKPLKGRWRL